MIETDIPTFKEWFGKTKKYGGTREEYSRLYPKPILPNLETLLSRAYEYFFPLDMADLFCGSGGTSTGLLQAAEELKRHVRVYAINHWDIAIQTQKTNHKKAGAFSPGMIAKNSSLEKLDPRELVPSGRLRLLWASPECTHFSKARGGKPMNFQSRASVKWFVKWLNCLEVERFGIENVEDFMTWGPLDRKTMLPIKSRKGQYFKQFIKKLEMMGYTVEYRVLRCADYGDPTTRRRLFILGVKKGKITWPEETHHKKGGDLRGAKPKWLTARDHVIDWSIKSESIFTRKKPLAENTLRRIEEGLRKFGGLDFVLGQQSGSAPRSVNDPIPTVAGAGAISLIQTELKPFVLPQQSEGAPRSVEEPLQTITTTSRGIGLVQSRLIELQAFLLSTNWGATNRSKPRSTNEPAPTITGQGQVALVQPFLYQMDQSGIIHSLDKPMPTVTSADAWGLVQPFLTEYHNGRNGEKRVRSLDEPMPTLDTNNRFGLVTPFLTEFYGTGGSFSIDRPLKTLTGRDRFGLVEPIVVEIQGKLYILDILFRMLQPHELARAMSFPKGYKFHGNREQVVKQIGNAVPVSMAKQLSLALLRDIPPSFRFNFNMPTFARAFSLSVFALLAALQ